MPLSQWDALGSGCFPDKMGFMPGVLVTGGCYSEHSDRVEDVHRLEQHPGMLVVARGGGGSTGYPARPCRGFTAKIRALHVASRTQTEPLFIHGIPWIWFCCGFF